MVPVMPDVDLMANDVPHPERCPTDVWETVYIGTFVEQPLEGFPLFLGKRLRSAGRHGGPQSV